MGKELEVWKKASDQLLTKLDPLTFELWVAPVKPHSFENGVLMLEVPNQIYAQWCEKNIKQHLLGPLGPLEAGVASIDFIYQDPDLTQEAPRYPAGLSEVRANLASAPTEPVLFRPKYTFDHFVVGTTNRLAYAVSLDVARNPGKQYNPVFIHGNSGLGKTHLLYAIQNEMRLKNPSLKVICSSGETFVNEYIDAIKNKTIDAYRGRYRNAACLLIDDIQFLIGKEQSTQEFFHTFNALFETSRQVVLTSDRPPKDLQDLDARLVSRFQWGVTPDIKPPDFDTRLAILRKKVEVEGIQIRDEILQLLAQNIKTNIRVLEGSLKNLIAFSCLTGNPINQETVDMILKQMKEDAPGEMGAVPSLRLIQDTVGEAFHVTAADIKDKSRSATKVWPRQVAIYLARTMTSHSLEEIGR
jgi:chromosomal replication initiator protein